MFCQATGYGGTVQQGETVEEKLRKRAREEDATLETAAAARNLTVSFNADVSDGMNWKFTPTQRSVKINPGQSTLAFYTAHNLSDKSITGALLGQHKRCPEPLAHAFELDSTFLPRVSPKPPRKFKIKKLTPGAPVGGCPTLMILYLLTCWGGEVTKFSSSGNMHPVFLASSTCWHLCHAISTRAFGGCEGQAYPASY